MNFVPAAVSAVSGANNDKSAVIIPAISAAAGTPTVTVQEIYADLMFAVLIRGLTPQVTTCQFCSAMTGYLPRGLRLGYGPDLTS